MGEGGGEMALESLECRVKQNMKEEAACRRRAKISSCFGRDK
jgi:hypothetical protein